MKSPEEESTGPVIRDLRRIDPETGQVRGTGRPGSPLRGPGSARPGKHAVSKPGGKAGGESAMAKLGRTSFGEDGDPFDPNLHEALMHSYSADVTEPTCVRILQPGYRIGDRILRPARVAVAEPVDQGEPGSPAGPGDPASPDTRQGADAGGDDASRADGDPPASGD